MNNPGVYTLAAVAMTTALSAQAQTAITSLGGMSSATILAEMVGGTGGTSISALVQTTLDGGTTWLDVARFDFLTTAAKKYLTLSASAAKGVTSYAALAVEGVNDGLLGDQLRCVLTSVGTYSNTTVSVRLHAK